MGGRRRRRHGRGRGRGRLGLSPPIEKVVDVEVGGEGEALFGVQPVEPYRRASGGGGGGGEQRLAARHCLPSSPLRLRRADGGGDFGTAEEEDEKGEGKWGPTLRNKFGKRWGRFAHIDLPSL